MFVEILGSLVPDIALSGNYVLNRPNSYCITSNSPVSLLAKLNADGSGVRA